MDDVGEKILQSLGTPLLPELEAEGLTKSRLIQLLKEELQATEMKIFNNAGKIIYSDPQPCWEIRAKARHDILKLCAYYPAEKFQLQPPSLANLSDAELEEKINVLLDGRKSESVKGIDVIDYHPPKNGEETHE